ncbi:MAG: aminotransferase class V-fold PLP-dependent enzyme [Longimicrobiales bacterium]
MDCQKHRFSLPAGTHYLNCAYMGPLSETVVQAGITGIRRKCAPQSIRPRDFYEDGERVRGLFAALLGPVDASRIAIIPAVSYGIATVARNTPVRRGQNIVVLGEQFPSNVYAWRRLAEREHGEFRMIEAPDSARRAEEWNASVLDAIDPGTAVVALPHVHWTDGTRFDLERIAAAARKAGAVLVIDATQSLGAMPFDFAAIRPNAVLCAGYKWLLGPYSIGLAYYGERFEDGVPLEESWIAREGSEDFRALVNYRDEYQPGSLRYDVGEWSNFILLPMLVAALEQLREWSPARIQAYCGAISREAILSATALGFTIEDANWRGEHLFGLRAPAGLDIADLERRLSEREVNVSLRGSAVRVSPHVYNDRSDFAALADALEESVVST